MSSSTTSFFACLALAAVVPSAFAERHFSSHAASAPKVVDVADRLTPDLAPAATLALEALPASQIQSIREKNTQARPAAIQVGVVRDVPIAAQMRTGAQAWT